MKTSFLIFLLALSSFAARPDWVDSPETIWKDSGKVFVKIYVISDNLDAGMNMTESRFKSEVAARFCIMDENPCMYYNFKRESSYWEPMNTGTIYQNFRIYRLFSIKDIYSNH